jgi:hypothetical protein
VVTVYCTWLMLMMQAVAKEGLEDQGNVPADLSAQAHALSAVSKALLEKLITTNLRLGAEIVPAKL